jgi:hypothetical protein
VIRSSDAIVLPHAEPLSQESKDKASKFIELFGLDIMSCFYSQNWACRQAAITKISEQVNNLDMDRFDALTAEINKGKLTLLENYSTFITLVSEAVKDPVLKNFISALDLF